MLYQANLFKITLSLLKLRHLRWRKQYSKTLKYELISNSNLQTCFINDSIQFRRQMFIPFSIEMFKNLKDIYLNEMIKEKHQLFTKTNVNCS